MPAKADSHPQNADRIHDSAYQVAEGIVIEFEQLGQTSAARFLMLGRIKAIAEERDRANLLISDMRQAARRSATAVSRLASELDGMLAVNRPGDTFEPLGAAANRVVGDLPVDRALDDVARRRWLAADGEVDADGRRGHPGRDVSSWIVPGLVEPLELSCLTGKSASEVMEIAQRDIASGVDHLRTPSDPIIPETFDDGSAADPTNDVDETAILAERVAALGDRHASPPASSAAVLDSIRAGMARRVPSATSE